MIEVPNELIDVTNGAIDVRNEPHLVRKGVIDVPNQPIEVRNEAGAVAAGAEGVDLQRPDDRGIVLTINSQWLTAQGEREQGRANPPGKPRWRGGYASVGGRRGFGSPGTVRPTSDGAGGRFVLPMAESARETSLPKQNPGACGWLRGLGCSRGR